MFQQPFKGGAGRHPIKLLITTALVDCVAWYQPRSAVNKPFLFKI